ncbi:MAG: fasciclin domain-containing protein [Prevotella sp.]|nr:fasciclin domain-containing protein [Prevotella sp.]
MKRKTILNRGRRVAIAACGLLIGTSVLHSCKDDDVLTGQPSWLGNSIYERLQEEGNYTTTLRLIDDLELREVLGHTGSKTLFAADDEAYAQWFQNNSWGVSDYSQLTDAQKRLLLNNSMINNAYLIELMSNVSGTPPVEGMAMRRETASSIYDSVYVMSPDEMPNTEAWRNFKARGKSIPVFKDATSAPMIHFLPAYMTFNKITAEDLSLLTNGQATSVNEAWVNGKKVVERDITCKNGYIQKVGGVIESSPNMAEIIRQQPNTRMWSHLLDRFSAPYFNAAGTREYNRIYNNEDSVYTLRYFSKRSVGGADNSVLPDGTTQAKAQLTFDPGWNHYMYANTMGYDLHYDAGAMIVPTDEALEEWWNSQGSDLQDEYKVWDSIPDGTVAKLINVNMLSTFSETVPSKFEHVLNDAKEVLGITKENIVSCFMGCNGVVYVVNKVFSPAEYASVAYPALAHESTMNVVYWGINAASTLTQREITAEHPALHLNFLPYLLSMDSRYALILPDNDAMLLYIDPSTIGNTNGDQEAPDLIEFRYDPTKAPGDRVQGTRFASVVDADGHIEKGMQKQAQVTSKVVCTMFEDLVNQLIIVLPDNTKQLEDYLDEGYTLFKTKGGTLTKVTRTADGHVAFQGGWQLEHNDKKLTSYREFTKTNGRSYMVGGQMPLAAQKSVYMTLSEHPEYNGFMRLLENDYCDLLAVQLNKKYNVANKDGGNKNLSLLDNYNYTVFAPSTAAIEQLQRQLILPQWAELSENFDDGGKHFYTAADGSQQEYASLLDSICLAEHWYAPDETDANKGAVRTKVKACLTELIGNFVRYHVMDHSIAIGMCPEPNSQGTTYESMKRNPETGRFYPITATFDQQAINVTDAMGNKVSVNTTPGLFNNICREYWFEGTNNLARLYMGSSAVLHLIDQPLRYEQMKPWRQVVGEYLENN